jgi:hypothetical protein
MSPRASACVALALAWLLHAFGARADAAEQLIRAHFVARGSQPPSLLGREFMFEGGALVRRMVFERADCRGLFAWGGAGLRDVDLAVYSLAGLALAEDRGATAYGYTRLCADAGTEVFVTAHAYSGRGELALYAIAAGPRTLGRLPDGLPLGVPAGGRSLAARPIGTDAAELAVEVPLLHDERQLAAAGYIALGAPSLLEVRAGLAEGGLLLPAKRCFRVVAFVPGARGLLLELGSGDATREARGADAELVRLAICPDHTGPVGVRVRTRALRSLAVVRVFEQPSAQPADAELFGEERALLLAEARVLAKSRGFRLGHLGEAFSERGSGVSWPIQSQSQCLLFVALPEGRRGLSTLYSCAARTTGTRLLVRGHMGDGAVSLWLGQDGAT